MCKSNSIRDIYNGIGNFFPYCGNRVCKLLGIKYPILEGGMAWAGDARLAAAVSNSGGLGTLGAGNLDANQLRREIKKLKNSTSNPFAVNLMIASPYFNECINVVIEEKVEITVLGGGNPGGTIKLLKSEEIKVLCVVSSVNLALMAEREGADILVGEGMESGGHIGNASTMVLIPALKDEVKVPIIAAGGIAEGRTAAASVILGAEGIQMGTRFLASEEASVHENYKKYILQTGVCDTIVTGAELGHPVRVIKNRFSKNVSRIEKENKVEAEKILIGSLEKAVKDGDRRNGSFMSGQSAGLIDEILPVADIMNRIIRDMEIILNIDEVHNRERIRSI